MSASDRTLQRVEIDDPGPAHDQNHRTTRHQRQLTLTDKTLVLAGGTRKEKHDLRLPEQIIERGWNTVLFNDPSFGKPRIENPHLAAKGHQHFAQAPAKIAQAHNTHPRVS